MVEIKVFYRNFISLLYSAITMSRSNNFNLNQDPLSARVQESRRSQKKSSWPILKVGAEPEKVARKIGYRARDSPIYIIRLRAVKVAALPGKTVEMGKVADWPGKKDDEVWKVFDEMSLGGGKSRC